MAANPSAEMAPGSSDVNFSGRRSDPSGSTSGKVSHAVPKTAPVRSRNLRVGWPKSKREIRSSVGTSDSWSYVFVIGFSEPTNELELENGDVAVSRHERKDDSWKRRAFGTQLQVLLLCAREDFAFMGSGQSRNRGTFLEISRFIGKISPQLPARDERLPETLQLSDSSRRDELIKLCECALLDKIKNEVREYCHFVIVTDLFRDRGQSSYISVSLRFLRGADVVQRFIGFFRLTAGLEEDISAGIMDLLQRGGFDRDQCVAISYGVDLTICPSADGFKSQVEREIDGACHEILDHGIWLNRSFARYCYFLNDDITRVLGVLRAVHAFLSHSEERIGLFERMGRHQGESVMRVPRSCGSTWCIDCDCERVLFFKRSLRTIVETLYAVVNNGCAEDSAQCRGYLNEFQSFKTSVLLAIVTNVFEEIHSLSENLRCHERDFAKFHESCNTASRNFTEMMSEECFQCVLDEAEDLAEAADRSGFRGLRRPEAEGAPRTARESDAWNSAVLLCRPILIDVCSYFAHQLCQLRDGNSRQLLEFANPGSEDFLNTGKVLEFCREFDRLGIASHRIQAQIVVAKDLVGVESLITIEQCLQYFLQLKGGFGELILFFEIVLLLTFTSAPCDESFNAKLESYVDSARIGEKRTSALTLLSIERDLNEMLSDNIESVVDKMLNG